MQWRRNWEGHKSFFSLLSFTSPNILLPPEMVLKSCFEHTSCAHVAFFTRLALTHAGSCQKTKFHMTFSLLIPKNLNSNYSIIHILRKEEKWIWKRRYLTKERVTSGTKRENPNLINRRICSMTKIIASPGSRLHFPSWSYNHTRNAQLVHIDITIRNWKLKRHTKISWALMEYIENHL